MVAADTLFAGSIPEIYDRLMVPLVFESYATDLAGRVAKVAPRHLLEIAAGTGAVTRAMASLPASTTIVATDLNRPMLDHAKARQADDGRIEWMYADALALPFENQTFDVVVCQFGAMFFPDKVKGYNEARRVMRPGGHYFFNVWDRLPENEFAETVADALAVLFPDDPPSFIARIPHGYHDLERIRADLNAAGFTDISIDAVDRRSKAASPREVATAYCQGTPQRAEIEARDPSRLEEATNHTAEALARRFGNGALEGRIRAFVITATC